MRNLSEQFGEILGLAREHGIETVPDMPGMLKVGGLHVPMSYGRVGIHENNFRGGLKGTAAFTVPDERGNVFDLNFRHGTTTSLVGNVKNPETKDFIEFSGPDEFEKIYGNMPAADPETREMNMEQLDADSGISRLIGRRPGEVVGVSNDWSRPVQEVLNSQDPRIFDPRTGDVRELNMPLNEAVDQWSQQYDDKRQRRQGR